MVKTVLKEERLNCKKRKCHVNLDSITFNENCITISSEKPTFDLP